MLGDEWEMLRHVAGCMIEWAGKAFALAKEINRYVKEQ
jgi:hypothetical protein